MWDIFFALALLCKRQKSTTWFNIGSGTESIYVFVLGLFPPCCGPKKTYEGEVALCEIEPCLCFLVLVRRKSSGDFFCCHASRKEMESNNIFFP